MKTFERLEKARFISLATNGYRQMIYIRLDIGRDKWWPNWKNRFDRQWSESIEEIEQINIRQIVIDRLTKHKCKFSLLLTSKLVSGKKHTDCVSLNALMFQYVILKD